VAEDKKKERERRSDLVRKAQVLSISIRIQGA
jgi:hypothetical protein